MAPRISVRPRQGGFTYLALIILVTVIGLVGAANVKVDALLARAAAEEQLLDIGAAFSAALESYAAATPQGQPAQPPSLQALLKDPRTPGLRRHLRKIFVDPVGGSAEWGVVYLADRVGVLAGYSLSQRQPLKIGNFDARFQGFDNKAHIADWKFAAATLAPVLPRLAGQTSVSIPAPLPPRGALDAPMAPPPLRGVVAPQPQPQPQPSAEPEPEQGAGATPDDTRRRKPADQAAEQESDG
ncbi:MAG: type II secretion system protein [Massilia sp.]|nr:type II secretion system protein [Massilia sp.]